MSGRWFYGLLLGVCGAAFVRAGRVVSLDAPFWSLLTFVDLGMFFVGVPLLVAGYQMMFPQKDQPK